MDAAKKKKGFLKPSTRENFCIYWYNFRSNKLSMVGLAIVVISLIFAIFAPYVAPFPEHAGAYVDLANAGVAPNATFWFGTDVTGRDILSRVIFGFRGALKWQWWYWRSLFPWGRFWVFWRDIITTPGWTPSSCA